MAQATNNLTKRSTGGWLTASLLLALVLCSQAFAAPVSYTYDNLNRLTEANYNNGQQIITYKYDAAGNILSKSIVLDTDKDGIPDNRDNCINVANASQRDTDGDGYGNMCDGDLNNDGIVNAADLGLLNQALNSNNANADFNGDGVVNSLDLKLFKQMQNKPPGPSAPVNTGTATTGTTGTSANQPPYQPVILAVTGKVPLQGQYFDVEGFNGPDISLGDSLAASEWQISTASNFNDNSKVFSKTLEKTTGASEIAYRRLAVPAAILVKATNYWVRTRQRDSNDLWSVWSAPLGFTTVAVDPNDLDGNGVDDRYQIAGYVDTNANGIDDRQEGIRTLYDAQTGSAVGIKTGSGKLTDLTSIPQTDLPAGLLPANTLPYGLFNFRVEKLPVNAASPATVHLTFHFPGTLPTDAKWYKYDLPGKVMIDITNDVRFNGSQAVLTLTDGGITDADGVVNGVIIDPGGPALPVANSTGNNSSSNNSSSNNSSSNNSSSNNSSSNNSSSNNSTSATGNSGGGGSFSPLFLLFWLLIYVLRRWGCSEKKHLQSKALISNKRNQSDLCRGRCV